MQNNVSHIVAWMFLYELCLVTLIAAMLAVILRLSRKSSSSFRYVVSVSALMMPLIIPLAAGTLTIFIDSSVSLNQTDPLFELFWTISPQLTALWVLGFAFCFIRVIGASIYLTLLRIRCEYDSSRHETLLLQRLLFEISPGQKIKIFATTRVHTPIVVGWVRPTILFPASALHSLAKPQLKAVLEHEICHVIRNDYFVNALQMVIESALFFHPAAWWISSKIRAEREYRCDDYVMERHEPTSYIKALVLLHEIPHKPAALALAAAEYPLLKRVHRIAFRSNRSNTKFRRIVPAVTLLLAIPLWTAAHVPLIPSGGNATVHHTERNVVRIKTVIKTSSIITAKYAH